MVIYPESQWIGLTLSLGCLCVVQVLGFIHARCRIRGHLESFNVIPWKEHHGSQSSSPMRDFSSSRTRLSYGVCSGWWRLLWFFTFCRIGEASHPGPSCDWILGTFNSSGVAHRADVIASLPGDFWGMAETHLSPIATKQFVRGLQCSKSEYKNVVPGFPCPFRSRSTHAGDFTGVAALSKWPCRALPHNFPQGLYETSRIQVIGTFIQQLWITIGVIYGYPKSVQHQHPRFQTDVLLEALVDRIGAQTSGPRVIMGDFNWEPHELTQVQRLQDMGFVELQDLASQWWGQPPQPTGRGSTRIDCVFVSRELACLVQKVIIDPTQWPDHSMVYGVFASPQPVLETFHWRMPQKCDWPVQWDPQISPDFARGASHAYAEFWHFLEQSASQACVNDGCPAWGLSVQGRGQTLETTKSGVSPGPIRKSRTGEITPQFFGPSFRFAQQFKQARRLQAFVHILRRNGKHNDGQIASLWTSIRRSSGFPGGFCAWFATLRSHEVPGWRYIPLIPPGLEQASFIFSIVHSEVQRFEKHLISQRVKAAKNRRANDLRYIFRDCEKISLKKLQCWSKHPSPKW